MAINIQQNIELAPFTLFKIGGPAAYYIEVENAVQMEEAVKWAVDKKVPFFILGAGSNSLVADAGYSGVVIRVAGGELQIVGDRLYVDAGVMMARAVLTAARAGLAGFEWGIGIPGTLGGSVRGNAGCFGGEIKDVVERVRVLQLSSDIHIVELENEQCDFGYRDSIFKQHSDWVILGATLKLREGDSAAIQARVREITLERTSKQAIGTKCAGCVFKNIAWNSVGVDKAVLLKKFPELNEFAERETIPTSYLIDHAGLKGTRVGRAMISDTHANFILNEGGASAFEIRTLIARVKEDVQKKYDLLPEEEIQYLGF